MSDPGSIPGLDMPRPIQLLWSSILCDAAEAQVAYRQWRSLVDFDELSQAEFRIVPALSPRIGLLEPDSPYAARLKSLQKYCWSNNIHILKTAIPVLDELNEASIEFAVLKGGGILAADNQAIRRRIISDLDLLVRTGDVPAATEILLSAGWRPVTGRIPGRIRAQPFDKIGPTSPHAPTRIEIDLHHRAIHFGRYSTADNDLLDRSRPGLLLGRPVRYLCAVDRALVSISQAIMHDKQPTYIWVGDAVEAIRSPDFDLDEFIERARRRRFSHQAVEVLHRLGFLFGLPEFDLPERRPRHSSRIGRKLYELETRAVAKPRSQRSFIDNAARMIAEAARFEWHAYQPGFRTDLGVRLTPTRSRNRYDNDAAEFRWSASQDANGRAALTIQFDAEPPKRADFDVWADGRWIARLRLRCKPWQASVRSWRASIEAPDHWRQMAIRNAEEV